MAEKIKIFFICRHNSGSSQIAKACLGSLYDDAFEIESEGLEPAESVNPIVVRVMAEAGIDLSAGLLKPLNFLNVRGL